MTSGRNSDVIGCGPLFIGLNSLHYGQFWAIGGPDWIGWNNLVKGYGIIGGSIYHGSGASGYSSWNTVRTREHKSSDFGATRSIVL